MLLLRLGAIGDGLLLFPALHALRRAAPDRSVTLAAHPAIGPLAHRAGLVDRFLSRDGPEVGALFASGPAAARRAFSGLDGACAWTADADGLVGRNLRAIVAGPVVVLPPQPAADDRRHVGQYLLDCLAPFGIGGSASAQWDPSRLLTEAPSGERPAGSAPPLVLIQPGSGSRQKNWPLERFAQLAAELCSKLAARLVLLLGPAELTSWSRADRPDQPPWEVLVERPLTELAALLTRCDLYVGNDSGLTHLAGLCGAPTLALFGPTDPERWRPLGPGVAVIRRQPLASLSVDEVLTASVEHLGQARARHGRPTH